MNREPDIRPAVKDYIDGLFAFQLVSSQGTTDSVGPPPSKQRPTPPSAFPAGRFKLVFVKQKAQRVILIQTEQTVGHQSEVIPGRTAIGGFIQLVENDDTQQPTGPKLSLDEVDYFTQNLFHRFSGPLTDTEAVALNKAKDYALAVLFSDRKGIENYYAAQVQRLGN